MINYVVKPSRLQGTIAIPPSKSQTLRAILFASLAVGVSHIHNYLHSPDTEAMIKACRALGAKITCRPLLLEIEGVGEKVQMTETLIDAGNSGIVLRFIAAVAALSSTSVTISGDHSIQTKRLITPLLDGLTQLGVSATSVKGNGFAPIRIQGPIRSHTATISGEDSQPVSAILIAAACLQQETTLFVKNPGEKPWVQLTLDWLERMGVSYTQEGYEKYVVRGQPFKAFEYHVPGDLSSVAFPIGAALVTQSEVTIENVDLRDGQGDKKLIDVLKEMGAVITYNEDKKTLHVDRGEKLKGIEVDVNDFIDSIPILSVIACFATGKTVIKNASVARYKECNRLEAVRLELGKMGAHIQENADGLTIYPSSLKGTTVFSHHDHRMCMALTVAGLAAFGKTMVGHVECVNKTFPTFYEGFKGMGVNLELER